jgi:hypothetical protein
MARIMETRARLIFRDALFQHYIDGIAAGDDVEQWLKTHRGWFPDEQADYGYGVVMPLADGPEVMSKDPALAMKEAKTLMDRLSKTLGEEENADVLQEVCEWLEHCAPSSSALTEANVEARDFRLDFAQETLQSFKRGRSRSPRRPDDWDAKAAALQLDITNSRIDNLKGHIKNLEATVQTKDKFIADLEFRLALKEGTLEMMHELVNEHCRRAASR